MFANKYHRFEGKSKQNDTREYGGGLRTKFAVTALEAAILFELKLHVSEKIARRFQETNQYIFTKHITICITN